MKNYNDDDDDDDVCWDLAYHTWRFCTPQTSGRILETPPQLPRNSLGTTMVIVFLSTAVYLLIMTQVFFRLNFPKHRCVRNLDGKVSSRFGSGWRLRVSRVKELGSFLFDLSGGKGVSNL